MARILVIDDEIGVRSAIQLILEHRGHQVVAAECGQCGVEAIEAFAFDAVIVDICMPGMDGFQTIRVLRECAPKVPIVAISGYAFRPTSKATPGFLELARELGVTCCLRKPFAAHEIIQAVEMCDGAPTLEDEAARRVPAADFSDSVRQP